MAESTRIFVSHASEDEAWGAAFVAALQSAGFDVWVAQRAMPGTDDATAEAASDRELRERPIFIPILSPAALVSRWLQQEIAAAVLLSGHDLTRTILPVLARQCEVPPLLALYGRIAGLADAGLAPEEAARRVAMVLAPAESSPWQADEDSSLSPMAMAADEDSSLPPVEIPVDDEDLSLPLLDPPTWTSPSREAADATADSARATQDAREGQQEDSA
ncbi:MAG TPA: toll/interleukin-1 receptor domain-containing protein, partial [Ktedonobacterales bacterium]|nr:toll/interleukin-1 receptor domain-containing protein [Ktedonobacterales bacterium]